MNSIDALMALCALTAGFAILLAAVNESRKASVGAIDSLNAKTTALGCAEIIDSMVTNSASTYANEIGCVPQGTIVKAVENGKEKTGQILGYATKNPYFEVQVEKHYTE